MVQAHPREIVFASLSRDHGVVVEDGGDDVLMAGLNKMKFCPRTAIRKR